MKQERSIHIDTLVAVAIDYHQGEFWRVSYRPTPVVFGHGSGFASGYDPTGCTGFTDFLFFLPVLKELDVFSKNKQTVTFAACQLTQYPMLNKVIDQSTGGIGLNLEQITDLFNINHWILIQVSHETLSVSLPPDMEKRHYFLFNVFLQY
jgi:hypothetical protein